MTYLDLLGTRSLVRDGRQRDVFGAYEKALTQLERPAFRETNVSHAWFSDTFLLIAPDDSGASFCAIESIARWFTYELLEATIPLRGALACGQLYADFESRVFFGQALVEAYEYGEAQDWIGLLLCPSAVAEMDHLGIPAQERLNYALWEPHWTHEPPGSSSRVGACILGAWVNPFGENPLISVLREMASTHEEPRIKQKYERAIQFIVANPRRLVLNA